MISHAEEYNHAHRVNFTMWRILQCLTLNPISLHKIQNANSNLTLISLEYLTILLILYFRILSVYFSLFFFFFILVLVFIISVIWPLMHIQLSICFVCHLVIYLTFRAIWSSELDFSNSYDTCLRHTLTSLV